MTKLDPEKVLQGRRTLPLEKWQGAVDLIARVARVPHAAICRHEPAGYEIVAVNHGEKLGFKRGEFLPGRPDFYCREVVETGAPLFVRDGTAEDCWSEFSVSVSYGVRSYYGMPVRWPDGEIFGTVCVASDDVIEPSEELFTLVEGFRDQIEGDLKLVQGRDEAMALSATDDLTGLLNRRGFKFAVERAVKIAQRMNDSCAFVCLDMNGLKLINDQYGHDVGDEAIRRFGQVLEAATRASDVVARLGGDEFFVMALVREAAEVEILMNRIRDGLTARSFDLPVKGVLTFSAGTVVVRPREVDDVDRFMKLADERMYKEKTAFHAARRVERVAERMSAQRGDDC